MDTGSKVLIASFIVITTSSLIATTFKSGLVLFSASSNLNNKTPKFEIDKEKVSGFLGWVLVIFALNLLYTFLVIRVLEAALIYAALNTIAMAYGISYWKLLKPKKNVTSEQDS